MFLRKYIKFILSLPTKNPGPVVYILTDMLPVEGQIHIKALTFVNSICHLEEKSVEKQLALRQMNIKNSSSNSWFVQVNKILLRYELRDLGEQLNNPVSKVMWRKQVYKAVYSYWKEHIITHARAYQQIQYLNLGCFQFGSVHPTLFIKDANTRKAKRLSVNTQLLAGTFILQTNRAKFNSTEVSGKSLLCHDQDETIEHFILECPVLETVRSCVIEDMNEIYQLWPCTEWLLCRRSTENCSGL